MKKLLVLSLLFGMLLLALPKSVSADEGCSVAYGQYGECPPSVTILMDKMVRKPDVDEFVDNLSSSDPRFGAEDEVFFRLKVKNTSNAKLNDVTVKDFVPDFLEAVDMTGGSFDSDSREVTISAGDFDPDEEKIYTLKFKVVNQDSLPSDRSLICEVNKAQASADDVSDEDTSQFCIEKQILGVSEVPSAGPEMGLALLAGQFAALGAGIFLKKKSN